MTTIWQAKDGTDNTEAILEQTANGYQLTLEDGPFSGYPTINLTREDMFKLYAALVNHLGRPAQPEPPKIGLTGDAQANTYVDTTGTP